MDVKEIRRLLEALAATDVREFTYETGDYKLTLKRGEEATQTITYLPPAAAPVQQAPVQAVQPSAPAQEAASPVVASASSPASKLVEVQAPIVGTFYASPAPDAGPFVKVGDRVAAGTVLCIIEAMKLMNEIEAEGAGVVREVLVGNGEPVEYGQVLFRIEPA
ncbi:MAG: acetyl-CoA carboxylase biotin carboxyl carrier protein [Trueperaceae bacterium]|nr:acetyl-CoA carboxylase biotin carboxyl carrier protein [Trueperaceae bacterium]MCC6310503.1 acetyl-CoA carboxylase biotin carboxyl carrier protein [Trueperaceae bacterium]